MSDIVAVAENLTENCDSMVDDCKILDDCNLARYHNFFVK